jgi:hypothetical protein
MFHRGFFFGRLVMLLLIIGGAMAVGRGLYRSGYEQGFAQGAAFAETDGEAVPGPRPLPWGYAGSRPGLGPFEGASIIGLAFFAFFALMFMGLMGRLMFGHHGHRGRHGWGRHDWSRHDRDHHDPQRPADNVGPEKQPENYL